MAIPANYRALQMLGQAPSDQETFQLAMMPESERNNPRPGRIPEELGGGGVPTRPYQKAPNQLMGFRRHGPNKGFEESKYKHTQYVEIEFPDGTKYVDAIKGLNKSHALERAYRNWDAKSIKALTPSEALGRMGE